LRVAFAGTPPFAARALAALHERHEVVLVLTQPERPAGRGLKPLPSAVAGLAQGLGVPIETPRTLKDDEATRSLRAAAPDVMVVAAYGLLLPAEVLAIPREGCLNIHASLLPRWRGAAPIQRAILAGDTQTGVSIMRMDEGLDTGPVLLEKTWPIGPRDSAGSIGEALSALGAGAIVEALDRLAALPLRSQDAAAATYAPKVRNSEARIDWTLGARVIDRMVRAFDPAPGAETSRDGERLKIWAARPSDARGSPGTVLDAPKGRLVVACGEGALEIEALQRAGGKRLSIQEFLRGNPIASGSVLGLQEAAKPHK
jgi:methionyl-tRNA formyltransferase